MIRDPQLSSAEDDFSSGDIKGSIDNIERIITQGSRSERLQLVGGLIFSLGLSKASLGKIKSTALNSNLKVYDFKHTFQKGNYKYIIRGHKASLTAPAGSNSASGPTIRLSRQSTEINPSTGKGSGVEYYDPIQRKWHHESILKEKHKNNQPNPLYNAEAANNTHIPNN